MKRFFLHLSLLLIGLNNLSGLEGPRILSPVEYINGIPLYDSPVYNNQFDDSIIIRDLQKLPAMRWQNLSPEEILTQFYSNEKQFSSFFRTQSFCLEDSCPQGSSCQSVMSHEARFYHIKHIVQRTQLYKCAFCNSAIISKTELIHHIIRLHDQDARRRYSCNLKK